MTSSTPSPDVAPREDDGAALAHAPGVAGHHLEVAPTCGARSVLLMTSRSLCVMPGPALARDLVAAGDVDDVDRVVDELAAVLRGEVVAAALDEQQLGRDVAHQLLERVEVLADVLADRGVRAAAGLDGADLRRRAAPRGGAGTRRPRG